MTDRDYHIDMLRSIAILCMVEVHIAATVKPAEISANHSLGILAAIIGGIAAPLFISIAGWGSRRALSRRVAASGSEIMRWVTVRFTFLMAAQLIVNMIASQVFNWYTPGILSLLALCAVLAVPLGRLTTLALFAIFAVLVLTPFALTSIFAIDGAWTAVITAENLGEWLGLLFIDGTYPLLPWFAFFVLGAIIHDVDRKKVGMFLALSGCFSLITLLIAVLTDEAWALPNGDALLTFFPANSAFMITATFSILTGVLLLQKCRPEFYSRPVTSSFLLTGRISLTIYLLHFIPLRIIDGMGYEPSSTGIAIAAVFGYMLLWWPLAILHHRYAKEISLEALLRRLSTPPSGNDS